MLTEAMERRDEEHTRESEDLEDGEPEEDDSQVSWSCFSTCNAAQWSVYVSVFHF